MDPITDPFTSAYLANIAGSMTNNLMAAAGRRVKKALRGTDADQALRRCVDAGVIAAVDRASNDTPEQTELLSAILERFFTEPDTGREVVKLLANEAPNLDELTEVFKDSGYDPDTLPGIRFEAAVQAFEAAFLAAAVEEPLFQPLIQVHQVLEQTRLQQEMLDVMKELVRFLRQSRSESVGIQGGTINAQNMANGMMHSHTIGGIDRLKNDRLRTRYLKDLAGDTNRLPLDLLAPDQADPESDEVLRLADVYIALDTTELERMDTEGDVRKGLARQEELKRISAQQMINDRQRLVLLGDPGSGKTTLVNFLAHTLACAGVSAQPEDCLGRLGKTGPWDHGALLPVRAVLREFAVWLEGQAEKGRAADLLIGYLHYTLQKMKLEDFWDELHEGLQDAESPLLVLLDGLDEVPAAERGGVVAGGCGGRMRAEGRSRPALTDASGRPAGLNGV